MDYTTMGKTELRTACKEAGVKNYGKMTVEQMRAALAEQLENGTALQEPTGPVQPGEAVPAAHTALAPEPRPTPERSGPSEPSAPKRPRAGGKCAAVWDYLDAHSTTTAKEIREVAVARGWNPNNAMCELYRWRKFTGQPKRTA